MPRPRRGKREQKQEEKKTKQYTMHAPYLGGQFTIPFTVGVTKDMPECQMDDIASQVAKQLIANIKLADETMGVIHKMDKEKTEQALNNVEMNEQLVAERDTLLVMDQTNCTRERAIQALIKNDNDIVNAIMDLTM